MAMKILFVPAVLPYPLTSGGQIRIYNLLKQLAKKHAITLVSFIREEGERAHRSELGFCRDVVMVMRGGGWQAKYVARAATSSYPLLLATYDNARMRSVIADLLARKHFDLLHLEPFYVWPGVPQTRLPVVVSEHNIEYTVYNEYVRRFPLVPIRPFLFLDVLKLRHWERSIWKRAHAVTAVSTEDAQVIQKESGRAVSVVPNGVDANAFPFKPQRRRGKGPVLLFVGDFRWFPNRDAATRILRDIWTRVRTQYPKATLRIVGRHVPQSLVSKATKAGAEVRGDVADIAREYADADLLVAPHAIAGGTKFKMLEAMASGLAIVTTKAGMAGLAAKEDVHFLRAETPSEALVKITAIWENRKVCEELTRHARELVEKHYSWEAIAGELDTVWRQTHEKHD